VGRPGIVIMLPTKGNTKPAPTEARTSRMGRIKPLGAPREVMHTGTHRQYFQIS